MLIFFLLSCGAAKKQLSIETKPIDLITFKKNNYVTDEGKESLLRFQKDLIQSAIDEGVDPIRAQSMDPTIMLDFFLSETESLQGFRKLFSLCRLVRGAVLFQPHDVH